MFLKITQFVVLMRLSYALYKIKNLVDKMVNFIVYEFYLNKKSECSIHQFIHL